MNNAASIPRKDWRLCSLLILVSPAILLSACSTVTDKEATEKSIAQFRSQYNAGQYHDIYSGANEEMRNAIAETEFTSFLAWMQQMLGKIKTANQAGYMVNTDLGMTLVMVSYTTDFERGKAKEQFVWKIKGGQATLINYEMTDMEFSIINPPDVAMFLRERLPPAEVLLGHWLNIDGQTHMYIGKDGITSVTPQDKFQSTYTIESVDQKEHRITIRIRITSDQYDILSFGPDRRTMTMVIDKESETPDKPASYIFIDNQQQP